MQRQFSIVNRILAIPRPIKRMIALVQDALICLFAVFLAYYLRLGFWPTWKDAIYPAIVSIALALPTFVTLGLYRAIFRHSGKAATLAIAWAVTIYGLGYASVYTLVGIPGVPRTVGLIQPLLVFVFIAASRSFASSLLGETYQSLIGQTKIPQVIIYGAGSAGRQLARALVSSNQMRLVGFVDDDRGLAGSILYGVPIVGPDDLASLVAKKSVSDILLAVPSATRKRRNEIVSRLHALNLHVRTLPSVLELATGRVSVNDLKDLEIEDLLGRNPVAPDYQLLRRELAGQVVLVTGAGGSIGGELCRQIIGAEPSLLLLVEQSEFNLYSIHQDLSRTLAQSGGESVGLVPLLASTTDERRMDEIISTWRPNIIYHAAAYKHVPLVEFNVVEGVRNNVFSTLCLARMAHKYSVGRFLLVSTDKAVRPTNVMGATKRLAEMITQAMQERYADTIFSMVRFGNVLGSSGSVVPLFRRQIIAGGPITVTHPEITRYFMTVSEAAQLVLQAGAMARGGDVFVLDMGEPVKIAELARNMVELSGLTVRDEANPDGDIEITFNGLRPGEKLYEELLIGDNPTPSEHPRILRSNERFLSWPELGGYLASLKAALDNGDAASVRTLLGQVVPEYRPNSDMVDLVTMAIAPRLV